MIKTYHLNLVGNIGKIAFLNSIYQQIQQVGDYILKFIVDNNCFDKYEIHKQTYFILREKFPDINSKLIQQVRDKVLSSVKNKKNIDKIKHINVPIIIDYQQFNFKFEDKIEDKYFQLFIRFFRTNFPLEGIKIINKIKNLYDNIKIKRVELIPKDNGNYFKIFIICEIPFNSNSYTDEIGMDINLKNITLSNGKRFNLKSYIYRKLLYRKNQKNQQLITNWSRGFIRKISSDIAKYLILNQIGYLIIEDLKNIRKSFSRKNGTSKGKNLNYLINNCFPYKMFRENLENSCLNLGIKVLKIDPRNTSKTCSSCKSLNTSRPRQSLTICNSCGLKFNADLNGAKNILNFNLEKEAKYSGLSNSSLK